jgi:hypothetical protein
MLKNIACLFDKFLLEIAIVFLFSTRF